MMRWRGAWVIFSGWALPLLAFGQLAPSPSAEPNTQTGPGAPVPEAAPEPGEVPSVPTASPTATPSSEAAPAAPNPVSSSGPDATPDPAPANAASAAATEPTPETPEPASAAPETPREPSIAPTPAWAWATPVPGVDRGVPPVDEVQKKRPKQPFRGTELIWGHVVTTSALGVGSDYQSDAHQVYAQVLTLQLAYHPVTTPLLDVTLLVAPDVSVELTDSAQTTTRREPWLGDVPLIGSARLLLVDRPRELQSTAATAALGLIFPTSKSSRAEGHLLTVSPRLGLTQTVAVLGESAPALRALSFGASARYDHLFSEATTPVDDDLNLPAQDHSGRAITSDLLNGDQIAPNRLRVSAFVATGAQLFQAPLELTLSGFYETAQLAGVAPSRLELETGPVEITPASDARSRRPQAGVAVELVYSPRPELGIGVGYESRADLDSELDNPLYTPHAMFVAGLTLRFDELYTTLSEDSASARTSSAMGRW